MAGRILVVDDDPAGRRHVEDIVRQAGYPCEAAASGEAALARLSSPDAPAISGMILDLVMPDLDGMAVLERLARMNVRLPVIVQTARGTVDAALSAMRAGAFDFLVKPALAERVRVSLANALRIGALEGEVGRMRRGRAGSLGFGDIVMRAPIMERVARLAERAARSTTPVLLEGERGVGKALVARAIHGSSQRRSKPFIEVNCAIVPDDRIEPALFGMDAHGTAGQYAEAQGGTLLLNQIGSLPRSAQARLLRLIDESDAGGAQHPGTRLIATTNRRLVDLVAEGGFSEDLFHRLNVLPIWMPPLRERRSDIPELANRMLARLTAENGRGGHAAISREAMDVLARHDWPGNLRQLESTLLRAVAASPGGELAPRDFPQISGDDAAPGLPPFTSRATQDGVADQRHGRDEPPPAARALADRIRAARYGVARLLDERGELRPFEALEAEVIRFAVGHYRGHMSEVARRLGIGRSTLYRKLKDYGIAPEEPLAP